MKWLEVVAAILVIAILLSLGLGAWWCGRKINYSLQYKSMVQETVHEMVKKEALK